VQDGYIMVEYEGQTNLTQTITEEGITQAILKVARTTSPKLCFTSGHGEMSLDAPDEDVRSLSAIKGGMGNEGYEARTISNFEGGVPSDCSVLVVAGPVQPFSTPEANSLDKYLSGGGKALFMLNPGLPDPRLVKDPKVFTVLPTGLEALSKKWGAELGQDVILQTRLELFRGATLGLQVRAAEYGDHPAVEPLKGRPTDFDRVRSVRRAVEFQGTAVEILKSPGGGSSWAESDVGSLFLSQKANLDEKDIPGPVPFGVVAQKGEGDKETKLVVFGDGDFVSNGMVRSYQFNFDLFLNTLNWLAGEVEQISIRPKMLRSSAIELTPVQTNRIFYVAIILIPMLVLIFGMDLWWWRRQRG
jgi:hypothetical protein